jgi:hypothetical protein
MPFSNLPQGNGGDPGWVTLMLIFLMAIWGSLINYLSRIRKAAIAFNFGELLLELSISSFAAIVIGLVAFAFNVNLYLVLAMAGMAGHAGGRTVFLLDRWWSRKINSISKPKP